MLITVFLVSFAAIYATAAPTQILYDDQGNVVDVIPDADNNGGPPDVFSIYVNENATESGIAAPDFKLADGFPSVVFCTGETFTGQCVSVHSNRDHCVDTPFINSTFIVNSVGPDSTFHCRFYAQPKCKPSKATFNLEFPGLLNFTSGEYTRHISSYVCKPYSDAEFAKWHQYLESIDYSKSNGDFIWDYSGE